MEGFSTQELMAVQAACIYKANVLIDEQLYAIKKDGGITEENGMDVKWLTNTAKALQEIAGCMEIAAKLLKLKGGLI